jgi:death-on-curing protein
MIRITKERAVRLHEKMAAATGGAVGLREAGLLESALETAFGSFGGVAFYPTLEEKAARLGHSLVANHPFVDGNKRIGLYIMFIFLQVNGFALNCTDDEVVNLGLSLADGSVDYGALVAWLHRHRG